MVKRSRLRTIVESDTDDSNSNHNHNHNRNHEGDDDDDDDGDNCTPPSSKYPKKEHGKGIPRRSATERSDEDNSESVNTLNLKKPSLLLQGMTPAVDAFNTISAKSLSKRTLTSTATNATRRPHQQQQQRLPPAQNTDHPWEQTSGSQQQTTTPIPIQIPPQQPVPVQVPTVIAVLQKKLLASLTTLCKELPILPMTMTTTTTDFSSIDLSGSFLPPSTMDDDLMFDDATSSIPIFPEDFAPNQPMWPLKWWGIVDPATTSEEFLDTKFFHPRERRPQPSSSSSLQESGRPRG